MSDDDRWAFNEGTHADLASVLGSHLDAEGAIFRVWAPSASRVMVIGEFNDWLDGIDLAPDPSGVWNGYIPGVEHGTVYKYRITGPAGDVFDKADPVAKKAEEPPRTGSVVWDSSYEWSDDAWMAGRARRNALDAPISIYELIWVRGGTNLAGIGRSQSSWRNTWSSSGSRTSNCYP